MPDDMTDTVIAAFQALPAADGPPLEPGVYDSLETLRATEVLAVWYSGDPGSCPRYLRGIRVTDVAADIDMSAHVAQFCTRDYHPYQQLVVLNRSDVPDLSELPVVFTGEDDVRVDDVLVDVYSKP